MWGLFVASWTGKKEHRVPLGERLAYYVLGLIVVGMISLCAWAVLDTIKQNKENEDWLNQPSTSTSIPLIPPAMRGDPGPAGPPGPVGVSGLDGMDGLPK